MKKNCREHDIAIRASNLSKHYTIRERKRERLKRLVLNKKAEKILRVSALNKVSFEISNGDALGIIGKNGSGKSTLLQIICGTISATSGELEVNGRIAALLELGSGFNPEFTGRENIEINAILLGMKKKEVKFKIKDIIEFADIGIYIDQPVRTYSSGMIVRLAFAIIAHSDPDIMIIDEALAVGDSYFTQKCMRFIQRFKKKGTLVFVSHDPNAVLSVCNKAILLENGEIKYNGTAKDALEIYANQERIKQSENVEEVKDVRMKQVDEEGKRQTKKEEYVRKWKDYRTEIINTSKYKNEIELITHDNREIESEDYGGEEACIISTRLENLEKRQDDINIVLGGELVKLNIEFIARKRIESLIVGFILKDDKGLTILGDNSFNSLISDEEYSASQGELIRAEFIFTMPLLRAGHYSITSSIAEGNMNNHNILHWQNDSMMLESQCTSIAAGMAGLPMQSISITRPRRK